MVRESGFSPIAVLVHVVGIAAGIIGGFLVMDAIAPDLPEPEQAPVVTAAEEPEAVAGKEARSLFLPQNLSPALDRLHEQMGAGQGILRLRVMPGSLEAETASGDGLFERYDVHEAAPSLIAEQASEKRPRLSLDDFSYFELIATADGPQWYAVLDPESPNVGEPPWTYVAPSTGEPARPGRAAPVPVDAATEQRIAPAPVELPN